MPQTWYCSRFPVHIKASCKVQRPRLGTVQGSRCTNPSPGYLSDSQRKGVGSFSTSICIQIRVSSKKEKLFHKYFAFFAKICFSQQFCFIFAFCSLTKRQKVHNKNSVKISQKNSQKMYAKILCKING